MQKIIPIFKKCPLCKAGHRKEFRAVGKLETFPLVIIYFCDKCRMYYQHDTTNDEYKVIKKPGEEVKLFRIPLRTDKISNIVSRFMAVCRYVYPKYPKCAEKCRDSGTVDCPFF